MSPQLHPSSKSYNNSSLSSVSSPMSVPLVCGLPFRRVNPLNYSLSLMGLGWFGYGETLNKSFVNCPFHD